MVGHAPLANHDAGIESDIAEVGHIEAGCHDYHIIYRAQYERRILEGTRVQPEQNIHQAHRLDHSKIMHEAFFASPQSDFSSVGMSGIGILNALFR
jgi:hypothetical protein